MNTETLRTFIKLSEIKNYTQTANHLFVAQSTVTNRILDLERELGHTLFVRNHKQLQLTPAGEHFLAYARRMVELEQAAFDSLSQLDYFPHTLRLGSTNTIYDCHLREALLEFQAKHTDTCLNISINHSLPLIQMLLDNRIDLAFTYVAYSKNGIQSTLYTTDTLLLVTSNNNTEYSAGITQKELTKIPYYYCDFTFQELGSYIKNLFPDNHPFPLTIDRSANLLPFILSGNGYSFLPQSMVQPYLNNGSLIAITPLDFSVPPVSCYVQSKRNSHAASLMSNNANQQAASLMSNNANQQAASLMLGNKCSLVNNIADEFLQIALRY
jgi:DNA-binding transcriptional LysR family regulator